MCVFFFKQKTAYEMRISDWSSDVCSSELCDAEGHRQCAGWAQFDAARRNRGDDARARGARHHRKAVSDRDARAGRGDDRGARRAQGWDAEDGGREQVADGRSDRESVVEGKRVRVRRDMWGRRVQNKKKT